MTQYFAIVPAAGSGSRVGADVPKQYLPIAGVPLLFYTLRALLRFSGISRIALVLSPDDQLWKNLDVGWMQERVTPVFTGGETRAQSVAAGLVALEDMAKPDDWILVHDAARPCLTQTALRRLVNSLTNDPVGGLLAIPVADTLKMDDGAGCAESTVPRARLWQAQTPQMFRYGQLREALSNPTSQVTDEASAIERLGLKPRLVLGDASNFKVTLAADLLQAEWLLSRMENLQ